MDEANPATRLPGRAAATWPLFVATFFVTAGGGLIFPLLADLQVEHGLPTWSLGAISALYYVGAVVGQVLLAPLADRGRTRQLVLGGVLVSAIATFGFAVSTDLWQFCLARLLTGLAAGAFLPAVRATLVRTDPARAGLLLGRFAGTETGGFVFGPVVGTVIYELWGLSAPFFATAVALVGVGLLLLRHPGATVIGGTFGAPAVAEARAVPAKSGPRATLGLLRRRGVMVAVMLELAVFLPVGIYDSIWARYLQDLGGTTLLVGVGLSLYGIPFVLVAPRGGRLADRLGPVRSATLGMLVVIPTTFAYGLISLPYVITAIALLEAVGNATAVPGAQAAMARSCPPGQLAAGQGLSGAISQLAAGGAALVAAPVYDAAGPIVLFGGAAAGMTALVVGAVLLDRRGGVPGVPGGAVPLPIAPALPVGDAGDGGVDGPTAAADGLSDA